MANQNLTPKQLIRIKDQGVLSAESIVTARVSVVYRFHDGSEPAFFQVKVIGPASDIDLFILPYVDDDNADVEVEILDVYQPIIQAHETNLEYLDRLKKQESDASD